MVITAALRTCLYGSERMDRFVKKVKLTSDAPSTTAVCNSPSDATLQSSARQVADYEGSPLVIVLDSDCEANEAAICIQSSAMPTIQSRADFEPGVSFSQSHTASTASAVTTTEVDRDINQFDIGLYVNRTNFPDHRRYELLTSCWIPPENYEFKEDASGSRSFRQLWLKDYSPWLAYSRHLKGAFCKFCVLFPQKVSRGFQGGFIATPFTRYKDFHSYAKQHMKSSWHQGSHGDATNFLSICERKQLSVVQKLSDVHLKTIEDNRKKLYPIVSSIVFCGTHDLSLRGHSSSCGNFQDLLHFRIESGDEILKHHMETASHAARYTSVRTQNEIVEICGRLLQRDVVQAANSSTAFSILADETADISGKEQLSLAVRYMETNSATPRIHEEFLGYAHLHQVTAEAIACAILDSCLEIGLDMSKLVGQGYDGCSAMAGIQGGVQAIIKQKFPKAFFVHCSSHRLNLVVNDLNSLSVVRNSVGTIKSVIKFFRDSTIRRHLIPNIPMLCETRWTAKYTSIRVFFENFTTIVKTLQELSESASASVKCRQEAHQLFCAVTASSCIICIVIIAKYASMLEPTAQFLQSVQLDMLKIQGHIHEMVTIMSKHREECDGFFRDIFCKAKELANDLGIEIHMPRLASRQIHRSNPPSDSVEEYYRRSVYVPYLDSIISSLQLRFSSENGPCFSIFKLYPPEMAKLPGVE